eukprot:4560130-Amphidinium_carterae.1
MHDSSSLEVPLLSQTLKATENSFEDHLGDHVLLSSNTYCLSPEYHAWSACVLVRFEVDGVQMWGWSGFVKEKND